jgi:hypothetical protein
MWYHAITDYGNSTRYWWNRSRDGLVEELLMPLLSKHVVVVNRRGKKSLFNFGAVSYVTIVKTPKKLKRPGEGKAPLELANIKFVKEHNATREFINELRVLQSTPATRSLLQQAVSKPKNQIFVVMQFGDPLLDSAYEGVIKPLGSEFGYKVLRVDEIQDSGHITSQILESIASSKIVLIELTGERPNCYYEAGYAHALGKEIVFCIHTNDTVHFDLAGYRFIRWGTEAALRRNLRERLGAYSEHQEE